MKILWILNWAWGWMFNTGKIRTHASWLFQINKEFRSSVFGLNGTHLYGKGREVLYRSVFKTATQTHQEIVFNSFIFHQKSTSIPCFAGWFLAVQTLLCMSFICSSFSFISVLLYACAQICHQRKAALVFSIANNYLSGNYIVFSHCKRRLKFVWKWIQQVAEWFACKILSCFMRLKAEGFLGCPLATGASCLIQKSVYM